MDARVDAAAGIVAVGDERFSFELDARTGAAGISLGGERRFVRPLVWREKCVLSGFAHLGVAFLKRQLASSTVEGGLFGDEVYDSVLCALAVFVNTEGAGEGSLPLDPVRLASVTVDVCHSLELAPAALDDRPAAEVEMLARAIREWRSAGEKSPPDDTPSMPSGVTRIEVVPDPVAERHRPAESGDGVGMGEQSREGEAVVGQTTGSGTGETTPALREAAVSPMKAASSSRAREGTGAASGGSPFTAVRLFDPLQARSQDVAPSLPAGHGKREGSDPPGRPGRPGRTGRPGREALDVRKGATSARRDGPSASAASAGAATGPVPTTSGPPPVDALPSGQFAPATLSLARSSAAVAVSPRPVSRRPLSVAGGEPSAPQGEAPARPPGMTLGSQAHLGRRLAREEIEAIVEALSDRLEQTAFEMGVLSYD